jgi:hypothetical protein
MTLTPQAIAREMPQSIAAILVSSGFGLAADGYYALENPVFLQIFRHYFHIFGASFGIFGSENPHLRCGG